MNPTRTPIPRPALGLALLALAVPPTIPAPGEVVENPAEPTVGTRTLVLEELWSRGGDDDGLPPASELIAVEVRGNASSRAAELTRIADAAVTAMA